MKFWADVDLDLLESNYLHLKTLSNKEVFGVVKDNAYGHGAVAIAKKLESLGIPLLCVFSLNEAIELREAGIQTDILIFAFVEVDLLASASHYNFIYTVPSRAWFESLASYDLSLRLHIEVNTGMNRIGFKTLDEIATVLASKHHVEGIYTHFGNPENLEVGRQQVSKFQRILDQIDYQFKWVHLGNAPVELIRETQAINAARFGLGMYGYRDGVSGLKPIMELYARIEFVDQAYPGDTVGYDYTYTVEAPIRFGTIAVGYADGFDMRQALCPATIAGKDYDIIGKVCMNQTMIKVDDTVEAGAIVELIGPHRTLAKQTAATGIMAYVLVTCLNQAIVRRYKGA